MKGFQQTLQNKIAISGQALHSGKMVTMELIPQPVDTGIGFAGLTSRTAGLAGKPACC